MKNATLRACCAAATMLAAAAMAQDYPTKSIRMVTPFAPGGGSDIVARIVAQKLGSLLMQTIVVDNKPGASGIIGADAVSKAAPDGYTVLLANGALASNPWLFKKMPFNTEQDLAPVSEFARTPHVLAAHPSAPFNTVAEMVVYAKKNPDRVSIATAGAGQVGHLVAEMISQQSGAQFLMVHYKGSGASMNDLLGGTVMASLISVPAAIGQIESGRLKAIAVTSGKRIANLPNVPTVSETYAGLQTTLWYGSFVPRGTPKPIIDKLALATAQALADPVVRKKLLEEGMEPGTGITADFDKTFRSDLVTWKKFIQERGISID